MRTALFVLTTLVMIEEAVGYLRPSLSSTAARKKLIGRCNLFGFGKDPDAERRKEEEWRAQQEILALRRNPQKWKKYMKVCASFCFRKCYPRVSRVRCLFVGS